MLEQATPAPTIALPEAIVPASATTRRRESLRRRIWTAISGAFAAVLGLLPHVLHHAGPLAGAALFAGIGGTLLFGVLGLVAAIPFLIRLRRRTGGWRIPAATLALFAAVFSLSSFVIGPAISGDEGESKTTSPASGKPQPPGHKRHH